MASTANGLSSSLTEAQTYSREARHAEELANRLETQTSFFKGNSAAGTLNLSQAYREWGIGEIERNRDFYRGSRFDDVTFQLSPEGQALQAKFIEGYADRLRDQIDESLMLVPGAPITRPSVANPAAVRDRAQIGGAVPQIIPHPATGDIRDEVERAQAGGHKSIGEMKNQLNTVTKGASGASAGNADDVKEW